MHLLTQQQSTNTFITRIQLEYINANRNCITSHTCLVDMVELSWCSTWHITPNSDGYAHVCTCMHTHAHVCTCMEDMAETSWFSTLILRSSVVTSPSINPDHPKTSEDEPATAAASQIPHMLLAHLAMKCAHNDINPIHFWCTFDKTAPQWCSFDTLLKTAPKVHHFGAFLGKVH